MEAQCEVGQTVTFDKFFSSWARWSHRGQARHRRRQRQASVLGHDKAKKKIVVFKYKPKADSRQDRPQTAVHVSSGRFHRNCGRRQVITL